MDTDSCDICGDDPGVGSFCQHCGGRQYRYATDELYEETPDASPAESVDRTEGLQDIASVVRKRSQNLDYTLPGSDDSIAFGVDDSSDAYSGTQQTSAIDHLEHPGPLGSPDTDEEKTGCQRVGCGCLIAVLLVIFVVVGAVFFALRNESFLDGFSDAIEDGIAEAVETLPTTDESPLISSITLDSWDDVAVGDCFLEETGDSGLLPPTIVDCRASHDGEFSFIGDIGLNGWQNSDVMSELADDICKDHFEEFIGESYELSVWYSNGLWPDREAWDNGDHDVHCYVFRSDGQSSERAANSQR